MRALIVYESMFGNNQRIADAVATGLRGEVEVEVVEVGAAPTAIPDGVSLLVVGGPNHTFGMTRPMTREQAKQETDQPLVSSGRGIREWLEALAPITRPLPFAVFDTRADKRAIRAIDRAGGMMAKRLRRLGAHPVDDVQSFLVREMTGPLVDGELERAETWGRTLALKVRPAAVG
jgi:flavodoxin